jgi:hypothetical protein
VRSPNSKHVDLHSVQHAIRSTPVSLPKPAFGRATYSGLQHSRPDPEANTAQVVETDRKDTRERVVILGSGWAGTAFHCRLKTGCVRCLLEHLIVTSLSMIQSVSRDKLDMLIQTLPLQATFCHADSTQRNTVRLWYPHEPTSSSLLSSTIPPLVPSSSAIRLSQFETKDSRGNIYKAGPTMSTSTKRRSQSSRVFWILMLAMRSLERDKAIRHWLHLLELKGCQRSKFRTTS